MSTAQKLFMEYGYRAVSTRQIADACGLTQPALYHYFSDKQDMYAAVVKEDLAKTGAALERIAQRNESVEERLQRVVRYLLSATQHDLALMIHDIRQELAPETRTMLNEAFHTAVIIPITAIFADGLRQGRLRNAQEDGVDATTATYLFMSMLSRFVMQSPHASGSALSQSEMSFPGREHAEGIVHILLYGLARDGTPRVSEPGCSS